MIRKILYVDDELPNRQLFQITYRGELEVVLAKSAEEGLEVLDNSGDIEVVITDMRMPGKDGLEFIAEARKNHPHLTYCLLTGFMITEEIEDALESHLLQQYFKKPFDREQILSFVNSVPSG